MSSRSRTARPLTNQNCRSEVARAADGAPIQPDRRTGPAEWSTRRSACDEIAPDDAREARRGAAGRDQRRRV